jgi:hypothetical protein
MAVSKSFKHQNYVYIHWKYDSAFKQRHNYVLNKGKFWEGAEVAQAV